MPKKCTYETCYICKGRGKIGTYFMGEFLPLYKCPKCKGRGYIQQERR